MEKNNKPLTYGLLQWGRTEGNPGIIPLFSFGYGVDRLLIGFTFKIKNRFFNQALQPGGHSNNPPTAASLPRCASCKYRNALNVLDSTSKLMWILRTIFCILLLLSCRPIIAQSVEKREPLSIKSFQFPVGKPKKMDADFRILWESFAKAVETHKTQQFKNASTDSIFYETSMYSIQLFFDTIYSKIFTEKLTAKMKDTSIKKYQPYVFFESSFEPYLKVRRGKDGKYVQVKSVEILLSGNKRESVEFGFIETKNGYRFFRVDLQLPETP